MHNSGCHKSAIIITIAEKCIRSIVLKPYIFMSCFSLKKFLSVQFLQAILTNSVQFKECVDTFSYNLPKILIVMKIKAGTKIDSGAKYKIY